MSDRAEPDNSGHPAGSHFDRRGATYDQAGVHRRIAAVLAAGVVLEPGLRVLDVATGTGLLALDAAKRVGPAGSVLGVDVSEGMLAEAKRKAAEAGLRNIEFVLGDAERLDLALASFDRLTCSSALVLMSDVPRALRHWSSFLKPGGIIAFDAPAAPFGPSGRIAEIASAHGIWLGYAEVADTPAKCRAFLEGAGFEVLSITIELADTAAVELTEAIAFLDERIDHPAWKALKDAPTATRQAVRAAYVASIEAEAVDGRVSNDTALNVAFGRRPS